MCQREDGSSGRPARVTRILQRIVPPDLALQTRKINAPVAPSQRAARDVRRRPRARRRGRLGYGARQAGRRRRLVGGRRHRVDASTGVVGWKAALGEIQQGEQSGLLAALFFSSTAATESELAVQTLLVNDPRSLAYAREPLAAVWVAGFRGQKQVKLPYPCSAAADAQIDACLICL